MMGLLNVDAPHWDIVRRGMESNIALVKFCGSKWGIRGFAEGNGKLCGDWWADTAIDILLELIWAWRILGRILQFTTD